MSLWFLRPYPGLQKQEDTPRWVRHTSCLPHVASLPTMHVSMRTGGAGGSRVTRGRVTGAALAVGLAAGLGFLLAMGT